MKVNGNPDWTETKAGQQLQERLSSEKTLRALDHLLQRIDTLEKGVERLNTLLEQGPGLVSMAVDTVDDGYLQASQQGIDINERLSNALHLAEKLTAPEMVARIDGLLKLADQAPGIASMMMDAADDGYRQAAAHGIDIEQRLSAALQLAEKLTAPEMVEQLNSLLKLAQQAPGILAMAVDVMDDGFRQTANNGIDLATLSKKGLTVAKRTADLVDSEEFDALLHSDLFNPKTLDVLSVVSGALTQCRMDPPKRAGVFKLLGAVRDPEIQKAIGFLLSFGRNFGRLCNEVVEKDLQNNKKQ
ncbi:MAG: DUF1641 domain-containing protein [Phaeodactylibacter sp.]|nr:DUF1641 domain-containing protein [Phaeodactylibacter sp.]MCB9049583.1 DUF1641 domain-containing protein [Lewinellaceae bacterium]